MKIRFIKDYHDGQRLFKAGYVAEVGPSDGQRLIAEGYAKEESSLVYSRKYAPEKNPDTACIPPENLPEVPAQQRQTMFPKSGK